MSWVFACNDAYRSCMFASISHLRYHTAYNSDKNEPNITRQVPTFRFFVCRQQCEYRNLNYQLLCAHDGDKPHQAKCFGKSRATLFGEERITSSGNESSGSIVECGGPDLNLRQFQCLTPRTRDARLQMICWQYFQMTFRFASEPPYSTR
jgi:hypothetical protein